MTNEIISSTGTTSAIRWTEASGAETIICHVAHEHPFTIVADDRALVTLFATPLSLEELSIGYLFSSGFIRSASQVTQWRYDHADCRATMKIAPSPDAPDAPDARPILPISADVCVVREASRWIAECSVAFRQSGGVHAAGLFDPRTGPVYHYEDVARHNAADKVIGRALMDELDLSRLLLVRTGRTSLEIAQKAHQAGIQILIARGAPTFQALEFAQRVGITLAGFARTDGFTVYTHPQRILL